MSDKLSEIQKIAIEDANNQNIGQYYTNNMQTFPKMRHQGHLLISVVFNVIIVLLYLLSYQVLTHGVKLY